MNLDEILQKRDELEKIMLGAIQKFESETNTRISTINLQQITEMGIERPFISAVKLTTTF